MTTQLEWSDLWIAMKEAPDAWIQTTERMYWEMLECVPPRIMSMGTFLVGEPERHDDEGQPVYACFDQVGSQFYARYLTVSQFRDPGKFARPSIPLFG